MTRWSAKITAPGSPVAGSVCHAACRAGQLEAARYLAGRGADINWRAPWSGETPLDAARGKHERAVVVVRQARSLRGAPHPGCGSHRAGVQAPQPGPAARLNP